MTSESIERYHATLSETLAAWAPPRPLTLAASFAERWARAYEEFCEREDWDGADAVRAGVEAVWSHVLGRPSDAVTRARLVRAIQRVAPHMDDFGAIEPVLACGVVEGALRACEDAPDAVLDLALQVLEHLPEEEWPEDAEGRAAFWQSEIVQEELRSQLRLIEAVESLETFDATTVADLRQWARNLDVVGRPTAPTVGMSNADARARYRREVERALSEQAPPQKDAGGDPHRTALSYFGAWLARYMVRKQTVDGSRGALRDRIGIQALLTRNRVGDAVEREVPDWDEEAAEMLGMCLKNNALAGTVDADDLFAPHAYGPSLRRLWIDARRRGDPDGWHRIGEWARTRPPERAQDGGTDTPEPVQRALERAVTWTRTGAPRSPWEATVEGERWTIGLGDFPDAPLYGLVIGGTRIGPVHDWPDTWIRPATSVAQ